MKSYLTLKLNPPVILKETFLTGFSQHSKTYQLDTKAVQMACQSCPSKEEAGIWTPNRFPLGTRTYIL